MRGGQLYRRNRRYVGGLMMAAIFSAGARAAPAASESPQTLYSNATVIDGTGAPPRAHQDILVSGERIVAIGPHGAIAKGVTVRALDMSGRFIIPGLIDSHVHLATPPNIGSAKAVLRRDLYGGVTAVRDMADDLRPVGELKREALVGEIPAPDIYYAALVAGPQFFTDPRVRSTNRGVTPGASPWMQAIDDHTDIHDAITLARGTSATAIKIYADLPADLVAALTKEAHRQHMLVWAHGAVFPARPADVIGAGVDVVSHACYLAYQADPNMPLAYEDHTPVQETPLTRTGDDPVMAGLFRQMKQRGQILDATGRVFAAVEEARKADPTRRPARCTGGLTARLIAQAWRAGVAISAGTDTTATSARAWPELYDELLFLARDAGLPPLQVLHSATLIGAEAAGQATDMGSIAPGKLANLVILRADPSVDIRNMRSIEMTVKRGQLYPRRDYSVQSNAGIDGDADIPTIPDSDWIVRPRTDVAFH